MTRRSIFKTSKNQLNLNIVYAFIFVIIASTALIGIYFYSIKSIFSRPPNARRTETETFTTENNNELYNPETEVLIVFCKMEGCGHCVRFNDNIWNKVETDLNGKTRGDGKILKLIAVDPTHELAEDVRGFPTIKKYSANPAKYVEFNQKREVETFTHFCMN